jgi:HAMP domain-containing protein
VAQTRFAAVAAAIVIAIAIGSCGAATRPPDHRTVRQLALDVATSFTGPGPAFLHGVELELAAVHDRAGPYRLLLEPFSVGNTVNAAVNVARAVIMGVAVPGIPAQQGILYLGDLGGRATTTMGEILGASGLPQISAVAVPASILPASRTLMELVPDPAVRAAAVRAAKRVGAICSLIVTRWRLPLTNPRERSTCRLSPGPASAQTQTALAQADGMVAVQLLVQAERRLGANGDDRHDLMHELHLIRLTHNPLGPVAFDAQGQLRGYVYSLYRIVAGHPSLLRTLSVN